MKLLLISIITLLGYSVCSAQGDRYQTRGAHIDFEASVPTFEPIQATHNSLTIVLDTNNGSLAALALVKGFHFPIALMQEHFNENYAESDQYPKAILRGQLKDFDITSLANAGTMTFMLDGTLEFHGVKNPINIPVELTSNGNNLSINSEFDVAPKDYNIKIPNIVSDQIADQVHVTVQGVLVKK